MQKLQPVFALRHASEASQGTLNGAFCSTTSVGTIQRNRSTGMKDEASARSGRKGCLIQLQH